MNNEMQLSNDISDAMDRVQLAQDDMNECRKGSAARMRAEVEVTRQRGQLVELLKNVEVGTALSVWLVEHESTFSRKFGLVLSEVPVFA